MVEIVDVVDRKGRILRSLPKKIVHKRRLLHHTVKVFLFNKKGELYVQQRSMSRPKDPGLWEGSLAGHVVHGEKPIKAAIRETEEELGLKLQAKRFRKIGIAISELPNDKLYSTVYIVKNVTQHPRLDKEEVIQGHWEDPKTIAKSPKHKFRKSFLAAWKLYK